MTFLKLKTHSKQEYQIHSELSKRQLTWGFAILGQDVVIFIISNMAAVVWAGQASVGFLPEIYVLPHNDLKELMYHNPKGNRKGINLSMLRSTAASYRNNWKLLKMV